ncbi:MAG: hypothetical protein NTW28_12685 [Candidatus Solibacter sp.]|nr:hypothetical protein [Candidatus Solibacter sp.]
MPVGMALAALAMYVVLSPSGLVVPQSPAPTPTPGKEPARNQKKSPAGRRRVEILCADVPEPLRPLCRQLKDAESISRVVSEDSKNSAVRWQKEEWVKRAGRRVQVAIATVPDPDQTHYGLYFDRTVDSIQMAADRLGYSFDSFWLPWKTEAQKVAEEEKQAKDKDAADPYENLDLAGILPGALLFRNVKLSAAEPPEGAKYLFVLLVGESSVGGIRRDQFAEAVYYADLLAGGEVKRIPVIGPIYSGSFGSLARTITEAVGEAPKLKKAAIHVVSGNTTVAGARKRLKQQWEGSTNPAIEFTPIQQDDDSALKAFRRKPQRWPGRTAILSEGDTSLGATENAFGEGRDVSRISFPRGISQLREVYPELQAAGGGAALARLQLSLRGSTGGQDEPKLFDPKHLTVSQEAQMQAIASIIQRGSFENAVVLASDVLDMTFVCGYLRRACPNVRVIVFDWDLLFLRAAEQWSMDGVLAVSTLPPPPANLLMPTGEAENWLPLLLASQFERAQYEASLTALRWLVASGTAAAPASELWLSVVGRDAIWPLRDLTDARAGRLATKRIRTSKPLTVLLSMLLLAVISYCALLLLSLLGPVRRSPWFPRPMAANTGWQEPGFAGRYAYHAFAVLVLGCVTYSVISPLAGLKMQVAPLGWLHWLSPTVLVLSFGTALVLLVHFNVKLLRGAKATGDGTGTVLPCNVFMAATLAAATVYCVYWRQASVSDSLLNQDFWSLRCIEMLSGASPVMPFFLIGCGLLSFAWVHMRRHETFVHARPDEPELPGISPEKAAAAVPPLDGNAMLLFCVFAVVSVWALNLLKRQSVEGVSYDHLYLVSLGLLLAAVAAATFRLRAWWGGLAAMLVKLEHAPVRRAFTALPPEYSRSPLWPTSGHHDHRLVLTRSLDCLRAIADHSTELAQKGEMEEQIAKLDDQTRLCILAEARLAPDRVAQYRTLQRTLISVTGLLAARLTAHWDRGLSARESEGGAAAQHPSGTAAIGIRLMEEFIALRYVAVIRYHMRQMWYQTWFLALGFFFAILSTTVYPFRSQGTLRWMGTALLVLLGGVVSQVLLQIGSNPILKRLSAAESGKEASNTGNLLLRLAIYGGLPLLGVINTYVPMLGRLLSSLVEPAMTGLPK